jgi:hypothetical protein
LISAFTLLSNSHGSSVSVDKSSIGENLGSMSDHQFSTPPSSAMVPSRHGTATTSPFFAVCLTLLQSHKKNVSASTLFEMCLKYINYVSFTLVSAVMNLRVP